MLREGALGLELGTAIQVRASGTTSRPGVRVPVSNEGTVLLPLLARAGVEVMVEVAVAQVGGTYSQTLFGRAPRQGRCGLGLGKGSVTLGRPPGCKQQSLSSNPGQL